jgi:hypothetical protein
MYDNNDTSRKLRYPETRTLDCTLKEDIFDGELFRQLKDRRVTRDGESFSRTYFEDDTEVALGLQMHPGQLRTIRKIDFTAESDLRRRSVIMLFLLLKHISQHGNIPTTICTQE